MRPRVIVTSDPRVPKGERSVNADWDLHVADIVDKKTGESIGKERVFLIDLDEGMIGRYSPDPEKKLRSQAGETYHEFIRGDFAIVWNADAPDEIFEGGLVDAEDKP